MAEIVVFPPGGYRYIKGAFQYSGGVAAEPGFEIHRARLARPLPLAAGFAAVEAHLASIGRPTTAFCACELRSPAPFSESGFVAFNREYVKTLERWGIYRDEANPVARTNVCPEIDPPAEPSLWAFSYTTAAQPGRRGSFVIAGAGEHVDGPGSFRDSIVRFGDTSPDGMRDKIRCVVGTMAGRLEALGFSWADALATNAYCIHDFGALLADEIVRPGAASAGLVWHFARPPIEGIDYEMDVRAPAREIAI